MWIQIFKCDECGRLIEDEAKVAEHIRQHGIVRQIDKRYPREDTCAFFNGSHFIQRSAEWLDDYKLVIQRLVEGQYADAKPWTYGFFRYLSDSDHYLYKHANRINSICPKCFREWGQPYLANHCNCDGTITKD